jgi:hypothetical protein
MSLGSLLVEERLVRGRQMMDYIGVVGDSCLVYAISADFVFCFILPFFIFFFSWRGDCDTANDGTMGLM